MSSSECNRSVTLALLAADRRIEYYETRHPSPPLYPDQYTFYQLNLQRLPALLERDRAAGFAADVSQPPPPGESDPPFWSPQPSQPTRRERREVRQHQREDTRLTGEAVASTWSEYRRLSETLAKAVQEAPPGQTGNVTDSATNYTDGNSEISNVGVDSGSESSVTSRELMAQLGRVIAGCSKLLRLRGVIGELEARALNVMSRRGSPVLLAAVEAYGVHQDLEVGVCSA